MTAVGANLQMLDVLRSKLRSPWDRRLEILESGCAGLELSLAGRRYDRIVASMMLGELPSPVRRHCLKLVAGLLAPGGLLLIRDKLWPETPAASLLYHFLWWLFFIPHFILIRTLITPVAGLSEELAAAGLQLVRRERLSGSVVSILVASHREQVS